MTSYGPLVLILAGYSCAGKTTIATYLAQSHGFMLVHEKAIVQHLALAKGFARARFWLRAVGVDQFVREVIQGTVTQMLAVSSNRPFVIDAGFGPSMVTTIRSALPSSHICVVAVDAPRNMRLVRMKGRLESPSPEADDELVFRDDVLADSGLDALMAVADFSVSNTGTASDTSRQIYQFLIRHHFLRQI